MGDMSYAVTDNSDAVRIDDPIWLGREAKRMAEVLLRDEHRGPGDTIEAAAYRVSTKYHVEYTVLMQGWQRDAREWKVSRWMALLSAYGTARKSVYVRNREEAVATGVNPAVMRMADALAGHADRMAGCAVSPAGPMDTQP